MPDINDLRQFRAKNVEKVQALIKLEQDGTELTDEQIAEFDALEDENTSLTAKIERLESAEKMATASAKPITGINLPKEHPTPKKPDIKGAKAARLIMAIGATGGGGREAAHYAETHFHDADVAMALNTQTGNAGGVLIPQHFMSDVIELLTPQSVVRSLQPIVLPMPHGNVSIPRIAGGATSNYIGEGDNISASKQTFGDLELSAKNLATLVPVSNQLINYSGVNPNIEQVIIGDMVNSMGLREDLAFIRGDGANNTPKGFRHVALAANILLASDGSTVQKVKKDLGKMELALLNANVRMIRPGYVLNPTTFIFLSNLVDGNSNTVFPEMSDNRLRGKPFKITTQVPANLGAGNESEIYLVDFADAVIGESEAVTVAVSTEASYKDPESGEMVSAFTRNQTLIRVVCAHDFGMRHDASVCVLTGINWS